MQRSRGKRAEFTASTNPFELSTSKHSISSSSAHRPGQPPTKSTIINHKTRTGLLPASGPQVAPRGDNGGGGATYLVAGKTVQTGRSEGALNNFGDENLGERLGRGRVSKDKRKRENKETEKVLKRLMSVGQGSSGYKNMKAVQAQNKATEKEKETADQADRRSSSKRKAREEKEKEEEEDRKRPFTSESIKKIGYDPTALARAVGLGKDEKKRKDEAIASLKNTEEAYKFNPKLKVQSVNVKAPDGYVPGTDKRNTSKIYFAPPGGNGDDDDDDNDDGDEPMIDLD
jgi:minichromosome maintenance protein 10